MQKLLEINKISKEVKKVGLETILDSIDKESKKDKIGKIISIEYDLIKSALLQKKNVFR